VRREVLRLATKHDRSLGEEFLRQQQKDDASKSQRPGPLGYWDASMIQRMEAARDLLDADLTEAALQFAAPAIGVINYATVDFLSSLREKNPAAADERYAALLALAAPNPLSDANTFQFSHLICLLRTYFWDSRLGARVSKVIQAKRDRRLRQLRSLLSFAPRRAFYCGRRRFRARSKTRLGMMVTIW